MSTQEFFGGKRRVTPAYIRRHLPFHDEARMWMIIHGLAVVALPAETVGIAFFASLWTATWWFGLYRQEPGMGE